MAQILTPLKKSKMTVGEWRFASLLRDYLDDGYLVWYNVPSNGEHRRYPDFLIFHPSHGLWCLEIKDWHMGNIKTINKNSVILKIGDDQLATTANPIEQARDCCFPVIDHMKTDSQLCQTDGKYQGKLRFPWGFGAVMCNWQRSRISEAARELLGDCFPPRLTWYKEDILEGVLSRHEFLAKLHGMLPYKFPVKLSDEQCRRVRAHIYPEYIANAQEELFKADPDRVETIKIMDKAQERLARELGDGHRVIHGVAGSGKTIILQHRVRQLAKAHPQKPILVICYNILLASLLKARLDDVANIEVCHFHDWCAQMKTQYDIKIPRSSNYADKLAETICAAVIDGKIPGGQYHAVLIDEGHDFAEEWLRALAKMPEGADAKEQRLLLLYDDAQTLYADRHSIDFSLTSVGIQAQGRTRILRVNYRNSEEICHYANDFKHRFMTDTPISSEETGEEDEENENTAENEAQPIPIIAVESGGGNSGIAPEYRQTANRSEEIRTITDAIRAWHAAGTPYGDIAVLYYKKDQCRELGTALQQAGIPLQNPISSDERKHYRPDPDKILVCTIHSSKGGEFPCVIISGVDTLHDDSEEQRQKNARLLYVGMTRAQNHLLLTAAGENTYTRLLEQR